MAVPKRVRYEVLRRDNFRCYYCGATSAEAKLVVDAVVPDALGGSHKDPANLLTACDPCNNGKGASNPDAPLVAAVAEDAARWAQALRVAQAQMLADLDARTKDHDQFEEWWGRWTCGEDKRPVPRDPSWRQSVDQLVAAGLPLPVLRHCVDLAMSHQKIKPENTFRYMCGIAWNKIRELHDAAGHVNRGEAIPRPARLAGDEYERGRLELARELLAEVTKEERDYFLTEADLSDYREEDEEPQTEEEVASSAISHAFNGVRCDWDYLATRVEDVLRMLPDNVGERALTQTEDNKIGSLGGPYTSRTFRLTNALSAVVDLLNAPSARAYLAAMSEEERTEWLAYGAALCHRATLNPDQQVCRAAECARAILDEDQYYTAMCRGPGEHIRACPRRAAYHVRIAELSCCDPGATGDGEEHKGHLFCESHLEEVVAGTYEVPSGQTLSARDFSEFTDSDLVPF